MAAFSQYSVKYDTVRFKRGGNIYRCRFVADTLFLNSDTLYNQNVWVRNDILQNVYLRFINDSVGIGTSTPTTKLDVVGNGKVSTQFYLPGIDSTSDFDSLVGWISSTGKIVKIPNYFSDTCYDNPNCDSLEWSKWRRNKYTKVVYPKDSTDFVSIGLSYRVSSFRLAVRGSQYVWGTLYVGNSLKNRGNIYLGDTLGGYDERPGGWSEREIQNQGGGIRLNSYENKSGRSYITTFEYEGQEKIRIDSIGNLVIGNTSASAQLDVAKTVKLRAPGRATTFDSIYVKDITTGLMRTTYKKNVGSPMDSTTITGLGTNISVLEPTANNYTIRVTEKDSSITNEKDSTFVDYMGKITGRSDEWVKNDTIKVDTSLTRLYEGPNIDITGTYPDYTISAINVSTKDSTYIKAGTSITVDSVGNTYTINNAAPDQTVTLTGGGITIIGGSYPNFTITSTEIDGSVLNEIQGLTVTGTTTPTVTLSNGGGSFTFAGYNALTLDQSGDTIKIYPPSADSIMPQGLNSVMAIDSATDHSYISYYSAHRASIHLLNYIGVPALSFVQTDENAEKADTGIMAIWGGGSTGYWDGTYKKKYNHITKSSDSVKNILYAYKKVQILGNASQNWSTTANGSYLSFLTTSNDSTTAREAMRITQDKRIGIGTTSPTAQLTVAKNIHLNAPGRTTSYDSVYVKDSLTGDMKTIHKYLVGGDSTTITGLGTNISILEPSANNYTIRVTEKDSSVTNELDSIYVDYQGKITGRSDEWVRNDTVKVDTSFARVYSGSDNITVTGTYPNYTITASPSIPADSSPWIHNGVNKITYLRYDGDSVGIGTQYPDRLLEVDGTAKVRDSIWIGENNWITWEETGGLTTNQNFNGRTLSAWGMKSTDHLLRLGNDYSIWGTQDSSVVVTTKGNLVVGDNSEKNYRLWVNGKIAAPTLTTAASEDSIIAWKASTGEFIAVPKSVFPTDTSAFMHTPSGVTHLRNINDVVSIGATSTNDINRRLHVDGSASIRDTVYIGDGPYITFNSDDVGLITNDNFRIDGLMKSKRVNVSELTNDGTPDSVITVQNGNFYRSALSSVNLYRYSAYSSGSTKVEVLASGTGITAAFSAPTQLDFTIPSGVRIVSVKINITGISTLTVDMGTVDMGNSSLIDRWMPIVQVWREDTGAEQTGVTTTLITGTHDQFRVNGLNNAAGMHIRLSF